MEHIRPPRKNRGQEKRSSETCATQARAERKLLQGKGQHLPGSCGTGTQERRMVRQNRKFVVAITTNFIAKFLPNPRKYSLWEQQSV